MKDSRTKSRSLVCLLPGLGDALVAAPVMRALMDAAPAVDALTMLPAVTEYARALGVFQNVVEIPLLKAGIRDLLRLGAMRGNYDQVVVPFPAARWQYAGVGAALGPRQLIMHDYGGASRLIACTVPHTLVSLEGGHRVAENMRLTAAIGVRQDDVSYLVPDDWKAKRIVGLLGVHPGSMVYKGNEARRWSIDNFAAVIRTNQHKGRAIRLFIGPQERGMAERLLTQVGPELEVIEKGLSAAARSLSECEVFVGNDAGMAHLAAGLGVKTVAIFGMTDPERAKPVGAFTVQSDVCHPCHDEGQRDFSCALNIGYRCLNELAATDVQIVLERAFQSESSEGAIKSQGSFRLYGKLNGQPV